MNILVTGASRGIGLAILERYAIAGWNLGFCSKDPSSLAKATTHLQSLNEHIKIYSETVNMGNKEAVLSFAANCLKEFETIDVLVNNTGIFKQGLLTDGTDENDIEYLMQVNLLSAYQMGKIIIPEMIKKKNGHIFNISSIAGIKDYENGGAYTVTKFALTGYTKQIRHELKSTNVKVTGIYPGAVLTDSWAGVDLPESRFIKPKDIAEMIFCTSLLSPSACVEDIIIRPQNGDI